MKLQFFSIDALEPAADQAMLDAFCASHRLVAVDKRFVDRVEFCYWSVCVSYLDQSTHPGKPAVLANKRNQTDYRELLSETDFTLYSRLRDVRKTLAEAEGVPIYAIFSNAQLAAMVTSKVTTLAALGDIEGVGAAKLEKYGASFLALLNLPESTSPTLQ